MDPSQYRRVVVHCGLTKTGTTYIQNLFQNGRDIVARHGVDYPRFTSPETDRRLAGNHSLAVVTYTADSDVWQHLARRLRGRDDCGTLLISAEAFPKAAMTPGFLEGFLRPLSQAEVKFVFYLRRFDHLIEGMYAEAVKHDRFGDISEVPFEVGFAERLAPIAASVGKQNIVIRPYNKRLWLDGDLCADFCAAIGAAQLWPDLKPAKPAVANPSLPRAQVFLLSRLRSKEAKTALLQWFVNNPDAIPRDGGRFFLSPAQRRRLNEVQRPAEQRFADDYGLGDIGEYLDLDSFDDDPHWAPFVADWKLYMRRLPGDASFAEELRMAASESAGRRPVPQGAA